MTSSLLLNKNNTFLYMIEVFINQLNIDPDKVNNFKSDCLSVHIKFPNMPVLIINKNEFANSITDKNMKSGSIKFDEGKSHIFLKRPEEFSELLKNNSIELEVHDWIIDNICFENDADNDYPLGKTDINLSGCLCDQFDMATNDQCHLPDPYAVRNIYELFDRDNYLLGTIDIFFRITCFGECLVTQFNTRDNKFFFKNVNSVTEFQCLRLMSKKEKMREEYKEKICISDNYSKLENQDPKPRTVLGLLSACKDYSKRLGGDLMPSRKFSVHKLNKRNYLDNDKEKELFEVAKKLENSLKLLPFEIHHQHLCPSFEVLKEYSGIKNLSSSSSDNNDELLCERLRGGGIDKVLDKPVILPILSMETLITGACKSKNEKDRPGCGCYGKLGTGVNKNELGCMNKPCTGIDCLLRTFKETQEFVDSIGKVPGMQGLGLMDPAESPYFNRDRGDLVTTCTEKKPINFSLSSEQKQYNPFLDISKTFQDHTKVYEPYDNHEFSMKSSRKSPMVTMKKPKRDEKIEKKEYQYVSAKEDETKYGPCGKVVCESKKKNSVDGSKQFFKISSPLKSNLKISKEIKPRKNISRPIREHRKKMAKSQSLNLPSNHVQISKKILKLVESTKSRFCYGHKSCVDVRVRVPGNMGWLWNTRETPGKLKPQVGWKPGAISRRVWNLLEDAKADKTSEDIRDRPITPVRGKKVKRSKRKHLFFPSRNYWGRRVKDNEYQLPPTLHIHRKNGDYYVTFYPIDKELINKPEEQQAIKPLYFQIKRNKNVNPDDLSTDSSSIASDMEIEFSPPAATTTYKKKIDTHDVDTLVYHEDIVEAIKSISPEVKPLKKKGKKKSVNKLK